LEAGIFDTKELVRLQHQLRAPEAAQLLHDVAFGKLKVDVRRLDAIKQVLKNAERGEIATDRKQRPKDEYSGKTPEQIREIMRQKARARTATGTES